MCRQRDKSDVKSNPLSSSGKGTGKGGKSRNITTGAIAVDKSAIEDLIVLIEMKVAIAVENADT